MDRRKDKSKTSIQIMREGKQKLNKFLKCQKNLYFFDTIMEKIDNELKTQ